jgi:hypothetical protein
MTTQVAGFRFGMTGSEAAAACTRSRHQADTVQDGQLLCSGAAESVGFPVETVSLWFCNGRLCEVLVIRDSSGKTDAELQQDLSDLKGQLTGRYGPGVDHKGAVAWRWDAASGAVESKVVLQLLEQPKKVVAILYSTKAALKRDAEQKLREKSTV